MERAGESPAQHQGYKIFGLAGFLAKTDPHTTGFFNQRMIFGNQPQFSPYIRECNGGHGIAFERDHFSKPLFGDQLNRVGAVTGSQHTVHGRRAAPALDITQDGLPGFQSGEAGSPLGVGIPSATTTME